MSMITTRLSHHTCTGKPPDLLRCLRQALLMTTLHNFWQVIEELALTPDQFVDLCILCGCDYCGTIKGTVLIADLCHHPSW